MDSKAAVKLDLKTVLGRVERLLSLKLPERIVEASLLPEEKTLHVRFAEAVGVETGEPAHPLIHVFHDERGALVALEIIDLDKLLNEPLGKLSLERRGAEAR